MWRVEKSVLFKRQLIFFAQNYKNIAGEKTASHFIDAVTNSIQYIHSNPRACGLYFEAQKHDILKKYEFRHWGVKRGVKNFPFSIYFRIKNDHLILLEAIYAHRMDTIKRLSNAAENDQLI